MATFVTEGVHPNKRWDVGSDHSVCLVCRRCFTAALLQPGAAAQQLGFWTLTWHGCCMATFITGGACLVTPRSVEIQRLDPKRRKNLLCLQPNCTTAVLLLYMHALTRAINYCCCCALQDRTPYPNPYHPNNLATPTLTFLRGEKTIVIPMLTFPLLFDPGRRAQLIPKFVLRSSRLATRVNGMTITQKLMRA